MSSSPTIPDPTPSRQPSENNGRSRRRPIWIMSLIVGMGVLLIAAGVIVVIIYRNPAPSDPIAADSTIPHDAPKPDNTLKPEVPSDPPEPEEAPTAFKGPHDFVSLIRHLNPNDPTTEPLTRSIPLMSAAHVVIDTPVYLCPRGDLWLTHPDAPPAETLLKDAFRSQSHVTRDRVKFARWLPAPSPGAGLSLQLIVERDGRDVLLARLPRYDKPHDPLPLDTTSSESLVRDYPRAMAFDDATFVPTRSGVSMLRVESPSLGTLAIVERHVELQADRPGSMAHVAMSAVGPIAWSTHADADVPSTVARWIDGDWKLLATSDDRQGWPSSIAHLIPLADGTVLVLHRQGDRIETASMLLESRSIDEALLERLIGQLSDPEPDVRSEAQRNISAMGPAAWPTLEAKRDAQRAEARVRIDVLLGDRTAPTLFGLRLERGSGRVVARLPDGGIVLHLQGGFSAVNRSGAVQRYAPAWLSVRPGLWPERLADGLIEQISREGRTLRAAGIEWIIEHDLDGVLRWIGIHAEPLNRKGNERFNRFRGIDSRGRWLLSTIDPNGPTLVIDPFLPDPRPRMPVWVMDVSPGQSGWDAEGWPAIRRGGAWALRGANWVAIKDEEFTTALSDTSTKRREIGRSRNGLTFGGGVVDLTVRDAAGREMSWLLPPHIAGLPLQNQSPQMMEIEDDRFLFINAPGRVVRLKRIAQEGSTIKTTDAEPGRSKADPFIVEAVFARNLPVSAIRRVWLDPAGRLIFASGAGQLHIAFPAGHIPQDVMNLIPAKELREAERDAAQ